MPRKKHLYAPRPEHRSWDGGDQTSGFKRIWSKFLDMLKDAFGLGHVDNGTGSKKTVYNDPYGNLRYDREKPCRSYGHPHDNFMNYSVQANSNAPNRHLADLAATSNGRHRAFARGQTAHQLLADQQSLMSTYNSTQSARLPLKESAGR
jgi:hypothetical protein